MGKRWGGSRQVLSDRQGDGNDDFTRQFTAIVVLEFFPKLPLTNVLHSQTMKRLIRQLEHQDTVVFNVLM